MFIFNASVSFLIFFLGFVAAFTLICLQSESEVNKYYFYSESNFDIRFRQSFVFIFFLMKGLCNRMLLLDFMLKKYEKNKRKCLFCGVVKKNCVRARMLKGESIIVILWKFRKRGGCNFKSAMTYTYICNAVIYAWTYIFLLVACSLKTIKRVGVSLKDFKACKCVGVSIEISWNLGLVAFVCLVKLCV